jgi:DNA-binding protein
MTDTVKRDNFFYVGDKPLMNYVTAAVMHFTSANASEIILKARGKFMNHAIDASQVILNRFLKEQAELNTVKLGSEELVNKDGRKVRVSTIEIFIRRK